MPSAVSASMRESGWNVCFYVGKSSTPFAGLFSMDGGDVLTFDRVIDEMRLCFECPIAPSDLPVGGDELRHSTARPWPQIGFCFEGFTLTDEAQLDLPCIISGSDLSRALPSPPSTPGNIWEDGPNIASFRVVQHSGCELQRTSPLQAHFREPVRRLNLRYLPPNRGSSDPRIASHPGRRKARARTGSTSPLKRSASGSVSPQKTTGTGTGTPVDPDNLDEADDLATAILPSGLEMTTEEKTLVKNFPSGVRASASRCAVTGKGRSWCHAPATGPALQACHVVPHVQYNVYPDPAEDPDDPDPRPDPGVEFSQQRLTQAWYRTWSPHNGILLLTHLHDLFDCRMFSIHPKTLRVRVFVPYDVITEYHGRKALLPRDVDRLALKHHYDMCCIENMAARLPPPPNIVVGERMPRSGTTSPFEVREREAARSALGTTDDIADRPGGSHAGRGQPAPGNPSKRARGMGEKTVGVADDDVPGLTGQESSEVSFCQPDSPARKRRYNDDLDDQGNKRRRREEQKRRDSVFEEQDEHWDGHLTPWNRRYFLSDMNWKLKKVQRKSG